MTEGPMTPGELDTPLGQIFVRMLEDPAYAGEIADDPDAALEGALVDAEDRRALAHDGAVIAAAAAEGEVSGFALTNNENITSILVNNENIASVLTNNENITEFMTVGRIRRRP